MGSRLVVAFNTADEIVITALHSAVYWETREIRHSIKEIVLSMMK